MPAKHLLVALLGSALTDPAPRRLFARLGVEPRLTREGFVTLPDHGLELGLRGRPRRVQVVFVSLHPKKRVQPYRGRLPDGLGRGWDRPRVLNHLGPPARSGLVARRGGPCAWDNFRRPGYTLHVSFEPPDGALSGVVLMTPEATPGS
jgi:hypothetical protein